MLPESPMDGEVLPDVLSILDTEERFDEDNEVSLMKRERRLRVGYTVDLSVNLGNSSHFDVHDASHPRDSKQMSPREN